MLTAHPVKGKQKSVDICAAFIASVPADAKGHVFYGVNETNVEAWNAIRAAGEDWYYIDNSYFDATRGVQFRVTKNAVQISPPRIAESVSDGQRWGKLGVKLQPWRTSGDKILICPQSPNFMKVVVGYKGDYAADMKAFMKTRFPRRDVSIRTWNSDKLALAKGLVAALYDVHLVVTHSSAAAITALIHGVDVHCDLSASASYINHRPDKRPHLMQVLADNQWSLDELKQGKAWQWLNR
jgi:hypothetical protein